MNRPGITTTTAKGSPTALLGLVAMLLCGVLVTSDSAKAPGKGKGKGKGNGNGSPPGLVDVIVTYDQIPGNSEPVPNLTETGPEVLEGDGERRGDP